jgi:alkylation response protein AidB-like acyl-CoA dehydrogenase
MDIGFSEEQLLLRDTNAGIRLHSGIGMTWEHDLHLYMKRAKASEVAFGDATWHRERVAAVMGT